MVHLRNFTESQLDLLDKVLVRYEFEIKSRLGYSNLPLAEKQSLENDLALVIQIYNHLHSGAIKIQD